MTRLTLLLLTLPSLAPTGIGDPQVRADHPWYPGELACSTFDTGMFAYAFGLCGTPAPRGCRWSRPPRPTEKNVQMK